MKLSTKYYSCSDDCFSGLIIKALINNEKKELESKLLDWSGITYDRELPALDFIFECKTIEELCGYLLKEAHLQSICDDESSKPPEKEESFPNTEELAKSYNMLSKGLCNVESVDKKDLLSFVCSLHREAVYLENICSLTFVFEKYDVVINLCPNTELDEGEKISGGDEPLLCHIYSTDLQAVDFAAHEKSWDFTEELCLPKDFSEEINNFIHTHKCTAI